MAEDYNEKFLKAEDQVVELAGELERLGKALSTYQAVADDLTKAAGALGSLATEQGSATAQLKDLAAELQRLGSGELLVRLDAIASDMAGLGRELEQHGRTLHDGMISHLETLAATALGQVTGVVSDVAGKVDGVRDLGTSQFVLTTERFEQTTSTLRQVTAAVSDVAGKVDAACDLGTSQFESTTAHIDALAATALRQVTDTVSNVAAKVDGARDLGASQFESTTKHFELLKHLADASSTQQTALAGKVDSLELHFKALVDLTTAVQTRVTIAAGVLMLGLIGIAALILTRS